MKTVLVISVVVGLAIAGHVSTFYDINKIKFKNIDETTAERQYKILELFENIRQVNTNAGYYKVAQEYDIKASVQNYENPQVVTSFFAMYDHGDFMPRYEAFTIFRDNMRQQMEALYDLFFYANDFETFYKTAAWARVNVNLLMFSYACYVAVIHREDTNGLVLPSYYEIVPEFYVNLETINKVYYDRIRGGSDEELHDYGIVKQGIYHFYYQNYSNYYTYGDEYKLAYLTEDIGWNSFYAYFHFTVPFWGKADQIGHDIFKERRGEVYYHFYQQFLARYYLERLSNGMSEIPKFSWNQPFEKGYRPFMVTLDRPFVQRSENYVIQNKYNIDDIDFVRNYENMFLTFIEQGQFNAYNQKVDFSNPQSINFVSDYWQSNPYLYNNLSPRRNYYNSYEGAARRILGGAPVSYKYGEYIYPPTALDFYHTSSRDPALYQLYNRIFNFLTQYKQYLPSYTENDLHYVGVKVNNVQVSKLETNFDFYTFNASNIIYFNDQELTSGTNQQYSVIQFRLNHEPFTVTISVKSDVEEQATFKVFIGPKYDSNGVEFKIQDNYMNFVELDWFSQKLTKGDNVIVRNSDDFSVYKDDSMTISDIYNHLKNKSLPYDMIYNYDNLPERLMLPRGTNSGFPLKLFVVVYKNQGLPKELNNEHTFFMDERPLGYPFDRPMTNNFMQPNMYMQDLVIYHRGKEYPYSSEFGN